MRTSSQTKAARQKNLTVTQAIPGFLEYAAVERRLRPKTIRGYAECIRFFISQVGDLPVQDISIRQFISFKARMNERGAGASRIAGIINAMKCLLAYARDILGTGKVDLTSIKGPRIPRRRVQYLTPEELETFVNAIRLRTWTGKPRPLGYCFRALVETLVASGMRISEALALNRDSINSATKEAVIIGKGDKQRTVFFTDRALQWIGWYLDLRQDSNPALFISVRLTRLSLHSVEPLFRRHAKWAGLDKHITPHILRHTTATMLLQKGCPIGFIKEILGHETLETTCRYYLGILTTAEVKNAHTAYSERVWKDDDAHRTRAEDNLAKYGSSRRVSANPWP